MYSFLLTLEVLIAISIVVLVLLQPHEGEGMGAVFGGSSSVETFLGTKTISVLWKATVVLGILFISIAIILNIISSPGTSEEGAVQDEPAVEEPVENGSTNGTGSGSTPNGTTDPSGESSSGDGSGSNQQ